MKKQLIFVLALASAVGACQIQTFAPTRTPLLSQRAQTSTEHSVDGEADMLYLSPRRSWQNNSSLAHLSLSTTGRVALASGQTQGHWRSAAQAVPGPFKALMPAWQMTPPAGVKVEWQIRVSDDQRQWSSWLPLL